MEKSPSLYIYAIYYEKKCGLSSLPKYRGRSQKRPYAVACGGMFGSRRQVAASCRNPPQVAATGGTQAKRPEGTPPYQQSDGLCSRPVGEVQKYRTAHAKGVFEPISWLKIQRWTGCGASCGTDCETDCGTLCGTFWNGSAQIAIDSKCRFCCFAIWQMVTRGLYHSLRIVTKGYESNKPTAFLRNPKNPPLFVPVLRW